MSQAITREQSRRVDELASSELGIPGIVLMENAGINAASVVLDTIDSHFHIAMTEAHICVLCGGGNNGGDGYVIARHLHNWGAGVTIHTVKDPDSLDGDALTNCRICQAMGMAIERIDSDGSLRSAAGAWNRSHALIDALLGTGFSGRVRDDLARVIEACNGVDGPMVFAVDVPSGLDCDTGEPSPLAVRADVTVTFVERKVGFDRPGAAEHLGRVVVADIGVPPALVERVVRET